MHRRVEAQSERGALLLRGLKAFTVGLCVFHLLVFLYAAARRMRYPFELEWIESNMLVSVLRIAHGQGLYVRPTLEYVPYLYAPLYLYLAAAFSKLVHGYAALRLLSTIATLGSCGAIYALVVTETRRRLAALAATGVFVGSYAVLDAFYDVGRVDSLFVWLLLLALLAQRRGYPIVAGLLWVLVFQTKQTVLPLGLFVLCAEWQRPRRLIAGAGTFLLAVGASILWLNHSTDGWYDFYIFHVARGLPIVWRQAALFVPSEMIAPLSIAWVMILAALALTRPHLPRAMFYLFVSVALFGGLWFVAAHRGASMNAVIPCFAWTAVLFGVSVARLLHWAEDRAGGHTEMRSRAAVLVVGATALQLFALVYNPGRYIPPPAAGAASRAFIEEVRALPGDVYVLNHSYDAILAGKTPHAEGEALGAVLDAHLGETSSRLQGELDAALSSHRYTAVVIDDPLPNDTTWHFERQYPVAVASPLNGFRYLTSQPQWFLLPCSVPPTVRNGITATASGITLDGCHDAAGKGLSPRP